MIDLRNVTKKFSEKTAVEDVSLNIGKGEVVGFLGPNGAGKTTTMRLIVGYLRRTSGRILIDGDDPEEKGLVIRQKIGYLPENNPLYPDLKTDEYLNFIAQIKCPKGEDLTQVVAQVATICGLNEVRHQLIGELSRGFKQRVGLAAAIIGDPPILILDEPTSGLDPNQILEIRKLIRELGREKTIILSTHIIPEATQTCDRLVIINRGRVATDKKTDQFGGEEEFYSLTREKQL